MKTCSYKNRSLLFKNLPSSSKAAARAPIGSESSLQKFWNFSIEQTFPVSPQQHWDKLQGTEQRTKPKCPPAECIGAVYVQFIVKCVPIQGLLPSKDSSSRLETEFQEDFLCHQVVPLVLLHHRLLWSVHLRSSSTCTARWSAQFTGVLRLVRHIWRAGKIGLTVARPWRKNYIV